MANEPSRLDAGTIAESIPKESRERDDPSATVVAELLADRRRRYTCYYLLGCEYAATLDEIVEQVAVWETETAVTELPEERFESIHVDLVHAHLPKLVENGIVEYDEESQLVAFSESTGWLTDVLHRTARREFPDS